MGIRNFDYETGQTEVMTLGLNGMEKNLEETQKLKAQGVGCVSRSSDRH